MAHEVSFYGAVQQLHATSRAGFLPRSILHLEKPFFIYIFDRSCCCSLRVTLRFWAVPWLHFMKNACMHCFAPNVSHHREKSRVAPSLALPASLNVAV
jgi:hypothetical protein